LWQAREHVIFRLQTATISPSLSAWHTGKHRLGGIWRLRCLGSQTMGKSYPWPLPSLRRSTRTHDHITGKPTAVKHRPIGHNAVVYREVLGCRVIIYRPVITYNKSTWINTEVYNYFIWRIITPD
jgi:hypothetical protein